MTEKKRKERVERARNIVRVLKKRFPDAKIVLKYSNTWELLVAVMLSAQCTDAMVNKVTDRVFKKYHSLDEYARAKRDIIEQDIKQTGFYRNKAKNIQMAAKMIQEQYGGEVPNTMKEILKVPGVARKTANVVLGNAHDIVEGIAVDTHVKRFAQKLNLSDHNVPEKIEQDLMAILPKKEWFNFTYRIIEYGRQICPARAHPCSEHPLSKIYPPAAHTWPRAR